MKPFVRTRLARELERLQELDFLLSREDILADLPQFMALSRERTRVAVLADRYQAWLGLQADRDQWQGWLDDPDTDADLLEQARPELARLTQDLTDLEAELLRLLLPKGPDDHRPAFLEIRAGTGGDESALFAGDLLGMYTRHAEARGWRVQLISESPSDLGGYKEVVVRLESADEGVYGWLQFESGGHRVQRIPVTESQGRIHTSACTVAVLPEPDEAQAVALNPADLRIDTFRASGAGGQHINKTDSAVRVTHLPTGLVAECQDDRSQHRNKAKALQVLAARLAEQERVERASKDAALRKGLVGSGDRSDRIRTYNFPQGRVTDHRINLTLYQLPTLMEGDMGGLLEALRAAREAELLADLEGQA